MVHRYVGQIVIDWRVARGIEFAFKQIRSGSVGIFLYQYVLHVIRDVWH